jgi:hypothetical protein
VRYESTDWSLEVPDGWRDEQDESCTTFCGPEEVGAFQVSSYRKEDAVTDADLREFAGEIPLATVSLARLTGFRTRFSDGETFWTKWWLRAGRQMIFVTYNCALADRGREDAEVALMLESMTPQYEQQEA